MERDRGSQIMRFNLLSRAIKLISITTTFQEYELLQFSQTAYSQKMNGLLIHYWGIIAIIDDRKIEKEPLHFWSVISSWKTSKKRDQKYISTMKGSSCEN